MGSITNKEVDFKSLEEIIYRECCQAGREMLAAALEAMDEKLCQERGTKKYRYVNRRQTTIKTKMGEVTYRRICYRVEDAEGKRHEYLLDKELGSGGEYGRISTVLADKIVNECMDKSFRKAAKSISELTGQSISHGGAWNLVQRSGELVREQEKRLEELRQGEVVSGELESAVLFEEVDGIWLSMQGKDRPKKGRKRELKIATGYAGWKETAKGRYETVEKVAYAGFDTPKEFYSKWEAVLASHYNTDEIEARILNGDGASWIKGTDEDVIIQLDPFHRSRAIIRSISDKEERKKVFALIRNKNVEELLQYLEALHRAAPEGREAKKIKELLDYFTSNQDSLLTWEERGVELPTPPEGIVYRRLGTQEHSNCDIITQRMKHRKASWSIQGGGNMAKLLAYRATNGLNQILAPIRTSDFLSQEIRKPLSAATAPKCDGKGTQPGLPHGGMPFADAFVTNGRKAIRNLLAYKPVSSLAFLQGS